MGRGEGKKKRAGVAGGTEGQAVTIRRALLYHLRGGLPASVSRQLGGGAGNSINS